MSDIVAFARYGFDANTIDILEFFYPIFKVVNSFMQHSGIADATPDKISVRAERGLVLSWIIRNRPDALDKVRAALPEPK